VLLVISVGCVMIGEMYNHIICNSIRCVVSVACDWCLMIAVTFHLEISDFPHLPHVILHRPAVRVCGVVILCHSGVVATQWASNQRAV